MAQRLEARNRHLADIVIVLDDQDAARIHAQARGRRILLAPLHAGVGARQVDLDRGADPRLALDLDAAARLLDEAVDHGEAQAGAAPRTLGGEEGLEDALDHRLLHAAAGVGDRQHHAIAVGRVVDVAGLDGQDAALVGHGVAAIDGEIDQRRFDLGRIDEGAPQAGFEVDLDTDQFAHHRPQHAHQARHQIGQFDRLGAARLLAGEIQQLADQLGAVQRAAQRVLGALVILARQALEVARQQIEIPDDHAQHIVEIMGDTAHQQADRFHLLRLQQLGLQHAALGDVETGAEYFLGSIVLVAHQHGLVEEDPLIAVGATPAIFHRGRAGLRDVGQRRLDGGEIGRIDARRPQIAVVEELFRLEADLRGDALGQETRPGEIGAEDRGVKRDRQRAHDHCLAFLDLAQRHLGFDLLGAHPQILGQQDALQSRPLADRRRLLEQIDEHRDLGPENHRIDRLEHEIDGAQRVTARDLFAVTVMGGDEDDRRRPRLLAFADQIRQFVAVDIGHLHVEQQDGDFAIQQDAQSLLARLGLDDLLAQRREQIGQDQEILRLVVDDQDRRPGRRRRFDR